MSAKTHFVEDGIENKYFYKNDELIIAINLARKNRLYSPMQGLLSNYIDFLELIESGETEGLHLNIVLNYEKDKPIGCVVLFAIDNGSPFVWSFVHEQYRNQGRASSMFRYMQDKRKELGFENREYKYGSPYLRRLLHKKEEQVNQIS